MDPIKVSVIVPVYNTEKYFPECAKSLMAQTLKELEIILVDDGSTDSSGKMCDEYAKQDSRIRVIHKPNGGVASARQTGLDAATGEYVIWADSDDWMESDMYEKLYTKAKETNADICFCGFVTVAENGHKGFFKQAAVLTDRESCIYNFLKARIPSSLCMQIIKLSFIQQKGISFEPHIDSGEDLLFSFKYIWNALQKVTTVEGCLYYYRQNNLSATHNFHKKTLDDDYHVYCTIGKTMFGTVFYEAFPLFWKKHFAFIANRIFATCFDSKKDILNEALQRYNQIPIKNKNMIRADVRLECFLLMNEFYNPVRFILFAKKILRPLIRHRKLGN